MSQSLMVELSDEVYAAIARKAAQAHTSPADLIAMSLEQQFRHSQDMRRTRPERSEAELQAARTRFERHFGAVDLGYATGIDNEAIDADLAREYTDTHEED